MKENYYHCASYFILLISDNYLTFKTFVRFEIVMANTLSFDEGLEFAISLENVNSIKSVAVD